MTCLTLDPARRVLEADLRIDPDGNLDAFLPRGRAGHPGEKELDLEGRIVLPGLIQTHVHLCQTLMRGLAERVPLKDWLRDRIWPLEAAHDPETIRASVRLGLLELATGGTTAVLDMGTTRHLESILEASAESGMRVVSGTALMDQGDDVPPSLRRDAAEAIEETRRLLSRYRDGRVGVCLAPRFIPSVSEAAWRLAAAVAEEEALLIHTHACETREEVDLVRRATGMAPFAYLERLGVAGKNLRAAHGVWLGDEDRTVLRGGGAMIVHCPGSNAKLGSGVADVLSLWKDGVVVGIGCDGAACNNRLDAWEEMRRAAHAAALLHGPAAVDPVRFLAMGTADGSRLLRRADRIGSLEPGKAADLVVLHPAAGAGLFSAAEDPHARVLYGAGREHVEQVWVQGEPIVHRGRAVRGGTARAILKDAVRAARTLRERAEATWESRMI